MAEKNTAIPNKNTSIPNKEVAALLAAFDPEGRKLVLATRGFVFQMFPDITAQVDAKARIIGYGYGPEYTDIKIKSGKCGCNRATSTNGQKAKEMKILTGARPSDWISPGSHFLAESIDGLRF